MAKEFIDAMTEGKAKICPECGSSDTSSCDSWTAVSEEDPGNEARLLEHQCQNCGAAFWCGYSTKPQERPPTLKPSQHPSARIWTEEQDSGLWMVFRGENRIGVIWDANREAVLLDGGAPDFRALESWDYGVMPGKLIKECATWHKALKAIVAFNRPQDTPQP